MKCTICAEPCTEYASDGECVHQDCDDACGAGAPPVGPHCPFCGESDMDRLCWDDDCENVVCASCGMCWNPNEPETRP